MLGTDAAGCTPHTTGPTTGATMPPPHSRRLLPLLQPSLHSSPSPSVPTPGNLTKPHGDCSPTPSALLPSHTTTAGFATLRPRYAADATRIPLHTAPQFVHAEAGDSGRSDVDGPVSPGALVGVDWTFDAWGGLTGGTQST